MLPEDKKLCDNVEKKAQRLVERRSDAMSSAQSKRNRDETARASTSGRTVSRSEAGCGCVIIPIAAILLGGVLDLGSCFMNGCSGEGVGFYSSTNLSQGLLPIGIIIAVVLLVYTFSANSKADRLKTEVGHDDEGIEVARQRLENARELQSRVKTLTGRRRSGATDDERAAAVSQLERVERELDHELA